MAQDSFNLSLKIEEETIIVICSLGYVRVKIQYNTVVNGLSSYIGVHY